MKIVYFNGNLRPYKDPAIEIMQKMGHEVIFHDISQDEAEKNRWHIRHFQMYEQLLDKAADADYLYFSCPIGCPEVFLAELKVRPNFKAKIVSVMMFRGINRSLARAQVLKELLDHPNFAKMIFGTMILDNFKWPENLIKVGFDTSKTMLVNEPFNEDPSLFNSISKADAKKAFGFDENDFVLLYSGSWSRIRGADLFVDCIKHLDKDIKVLIHKNIPPNPDKVNIDPTLRLGVIEEAKTYPNVKVVEEWTLEGEMYRYYKAADIVACSHRRLYEYSQSGIPNMAAMAKVPIVAPDFYYFSELINRYDIGMKYIPEDPVDMARVINMTKIYYNMIIGNARFEESLKNYQSIADIHPYRVLESLGI